MGTSSESARRWSSFPRRRRKPASPRRAWRLLLASAKRRRTVAYGRLMKTFKVSRGKALARLICEVDNVDVKHGGQGLAAIIVRKDTGYPGGGYFYGNDLPNHLRRTPGRSADPRLSRIEKKYVEEQQKRIWAHYGRSTRRSAR